MFAYDMAMAASGIFLLRIEDIDQSRSRPEWEAQIYEDLRWLGVSWPEPVLRQSERLTTYGQALDQLWDDGLLYPCTCSRKDIKAAASAPQEGVPMGPDGIIYPGTCRLKPRSASRPLGVPLRLDAGGTGAKDFAQTIGDVVLSRREMGTSYHLAVVVDDAAQGVTDVVRGVDLEEATPIHKLLQRLLGLPTPRYHHHKLIRDNTGKRLAKRDDARAIAKYRSEGASPNDIRGLVGLPQV